MRMPNMDRPGVSVLGQNFMIVDPGLIHLYSLLGQLLHQLRAELLSQHLNHGFGLNFILRLRDPIRALPSLLL